MSLQTVSLGKYYAPGDVVVRQGEVGDCMYVIQSGEVEVIRSEIWGEKILSTLKAGDFFGEMALFERETRSATIRAAREVRILTVDKRTFLRRVHEDPTFAWRVAQNLSRRIREMNTTFMSKKRETQAP